MMAQFKKATKNPCEYIKYYMSDDISVWYILLTNFAGNDDEYTFEDEEKNKRFGQYLVKMTAPAEFPFKPPSFTFLTPNGVYDLDGPICISIGEFHAENYRAVLGMSGFANQLISGIVGWESLEHGIRIIRTTCVKKKELAMESEKFNELYYPQILKDVNESYDNYSAKFAK